VPGVLVMIGVFGTANVGWTLLTEMQTGAHERMLVSPLRRSSLIIGRALKEMAPTVVQALVIIGLVVPFGFRLHVAGALTGLAMLGVLGVGIGALSCSTWRSAPPPRSQVPCWDCCSVRGSCVTHQPEG
jgi:ABC-2 type transport system permease protein